MPPYIKSFYTINIFNDRIIPKLGGLNFSARMRKMENFDFIGYLKSRKLYEEEKPKITKSYDEWL